MNEMISRCQQLSDEELAKELKFLAERDRRNIVGVLVHLAEFDKRRLAHKEDYPSIFWYCVKALRYDEGGAYRRIHAARLINRYPDCLPFVGSGMLTLTSLLLLSPVLTPENHATLFNEAKGRLKRDVELIVARLAPKPALPDSLRRLPTPRPACGLPGEVVAGLGLAPRAESGTDARVGVPSPFEPATVELAQMLPRRPPHEWQAMVPLSMDRVRIGFDAALTVMRLIERARQVLRHKFPEGRLEDVLREALEIFLERKDPQRRLALKSRSVPRVDGPSPETGEAGSVLASDAEGAGWAAQPRFLRAWKTERYVPARVKQRVWQRDDGRCAWRFEDGTICGSKDWIEFDHIRPFARGGRSDDSRNVRLLCRLHNQKAAATAFASSQK